MNLPFALVLFLGLLASCSHKQTWIELGKFDEGSSFYLLSKKEITNPDLSSIGGSIRWIYTQPHQLMTDDSSIITYTSKEATIILNCTNHTFAIPDYSFHNQAHVIKWFSEDPGKVKWVDIETDQVVKEFARKVVNSCKP